DLAALHGGQQPVNAVRARSRQLFSQQGIRRLRRRAPGRARLERTDALLQGLLEGAADGHHFADGLHLRAKRAVRAGKFLKLPFRNFYDDVVDGRLEAGRRLFRDVVGNSSRLMPTARRAAIFAIGKPVALLASAELRDTRGFISIMTMRPLCGLMANCTFEAPGSTPTSRRIAAAAARLR